MCVYIYAYIYIYIYTHTYACVHNIHPAEAIAKPSRPPSTRVNESTGLGRRGDQATSLPLPSIMYSLL